MEKKWNLILNPFVKIAGWPALLWGVAGLVASVFISYYSGYHWHGLLQFGPAADHSILRYTIEHGVVWLVPSLIFYICGLVFSKSKIRVIDVFGTMAFAQLPFIGMNLFFLTPPMQRLNEIDFNLPLNEIMEIFRQPSIMTAMWISVLAILFLAWVLVWMFKALKISTNLKGTILIISYCVGVFGGDIICRLITSSL